MSLLEGKVALVTGAGRGVGQAAARALAREGARVVINDNGCNLDGSSRDESVAKDVTDRINSEGGRAFASDHDIATVQGAQGAVQTAIDAFGDLDVLVCCAGIARDRTLLKMEEAEWDDVIGVGLKGTFLAMQSAARHMVASGHGGRMVVCTGLPGYLGNFAQGNLAAVCGGIHGLMRTASIEWQKHKITVNAVAPLAKTRMTEALPLLEGFDNLTPDHVAPAIVALASDRCGDRTGYVIAATGARLYAFRFVESAGKFKDEAAGVFTPDEIDEHWHAITKL